MSSTVAHSLDATAAECDGHKSQPITLPSTSNDASLSHPNAFPPPRSFPSSTVLIQQGAESRIFSSTFLSRPCVVKQRFVKAYRHPSLDHSLTKQRLWSECRSAVRVRRGGVDAPAVYYVDEEERLIVMERVDGVTVKAWMRAREAGEERKQAEAEDADDAETTAVMRGVGRTIAAIHSCGVIHGDLTTSNLMLRHDARRDAADGTPHLTAIDFGLAHNSAMIEDRAVDLYVLERAFLSTHPNSQRQFDVVLNGYLTGLKDGSKVLQRLHLVRQRGRKRQMVG
ncbi:serine/threonine-protein kinase bud32 [Xylographa carneopallida]|nr:serine/threonine-protein kinase bud32 [Xylographa carneopallida]